MSPNFPNFCPQAGSNDGDGTEDSGFDNDCADDGDEYDDFTGDGDEYGVYTDDDAISTNVTAMMLIEYGSDGIHHQIPLRVLEMAFFYSISKSYNIFRKEVVNWRSIHESKIFVKPRPLLCFNDGVCWQ